MNIVLPSFFKYWMENNFNIAEDNLKIPVWKCKDNCYLEVNDKNIYLPNEIQSYRVDLPNETRRQN